MSRYAVEAIDRELVVWVGWDEGLRTFFAQVEPPGDVDDDALLLWVGTTPGEVVDLARLASVVSTWTVLGPRLLAVLETDRCESASDAGHPG